MRLISTGIFKFCKRIFIEIAHEFLYIEIINYNRAKGGFRKRREKK